jgi:large subunit ribosomal protein L23
MAEISPYQVIRRPLSTEKSTIASELNQYVFEVDVRANKVQIREAVQQVFKVSVMKVRVVNLGPRSGRWGRKRVKRSGAWKKAFVTVAPGQKIEVFEGV